EGAILTGCKPAVVVFSQHQQPVFVHKDRLLCLEGEDKPLLRFAAMDGDPVEDGAGLFIGVPLCPVPGKEDGVVVQPTKAPFLAAPGEAEEAFRRPHPDVLPVAVAFHVCLFDGKGQIFTAGGEGDAIYRTGFSKIGDGYRFHGATSWGMYSSPL